MRVYNRRGWMTDHARCEIGVTVPRPSHATRRQPHSPMKLSVIVITKNGQAYIRRCLESVAWADERVVVDSGSTDGTVDICRELGVQVHVITDWRGHGPQKNRALDRAGG